jgi:hypothetical protein
MSVGTTGTIQTRIMASISDSPPTIIDTYNIIIVDINVRKGGVPFFSGTIMATIEITNNIYLSICVPSIINAIVIVVIQPTIHRHPVKVGLEIIDTKIRPISRRVIRGRIREVDGVVSVVPETLGKINPYRVSPKPRKIHR